MADVSARKGSLSFLNPFRSRTGSRSSSRASSITNLSIDDPKKATVTKVTLKKTNPSDRSSTSSVKDGSDLTRPPRKGSRLTKQEDAQARDAQTGERKDHTEMLHGLAHHESAESLVEKTQAKFAGIPPEPATAFFSRLPRKVWVQAVDHLGPADKASLAFSCKPFRDLLGTQVWTDLNEVENHDAKTEFLGHLDQHLPDHLLCFPCRIYHVRSQKGKEILRPTNVANPLFNCPNAFSAERKMARHRITSGRALSFPFVQLLLRGHNYSMEHGIPVDSMSRRYKDRDGEWTHLTRYAVVDGHLLVRVISSVFATPALPPAGLRKLLYAPGDNFNPYFSVCSHWRDGNLMPAVKCALSHIPKPPEVSGVAGVAVKVQNHFHKPTAMATLCSECRTLRRCPECPTEYLIEIRIQEDKSEPDPRRTFKHAIVVTRWSDLGNGSSPKSPEWAACNAEVEFDSFAAIGKRAISGVFESQFTVEQIPPQPMVSMNPNKVKLGEKGHDWY